MENTYAPLPAPTASSELRVQDRASLRRLYSRVGFALLAGVLLRYALELLLVQIFSRDVFANSTVSIAVSALIVYGCSLPLVYLLIRSLPRERSIVKTPLPAKRFFVYALLLFSLTYVFAYLTGVLRVLFNIPTDTSALSLATNPLYYITLLLLAPVLEELLFRRVLIERLLPYGEGVAIVFSALAFGLFHCSFDQILYATMAGLMLSYVYCRTRRVGCTMLLHFLLNLVSAVTTLVLFSGNADANSFSGGLLLYNYLILALLITGYVLLFKRRSQLQLSSLHTPKGGRLAFCNVGMLLYVAACLIAVAWDVYTRVIG